jgi:hypothetical protein
MTAYEETVAFYYAIGRAITAWTNVERALLWIVTACFTKHNLDNAAIAFFSIENFRTKILAADRLFNTKFEGTAHIKQWKDLLTSLERLSQIRNHLVHYHTMGYMNAVPGRRIALIATLLAKTKFRQKNQKPPSGSLCLKDIVYARRQFEALAYGLEFLVHRVKKQKTQLPTSLAQAGDPPTIAQLTHQIRAILSQQP